MIRETPKQYDTSRRNGGVSAIARELENIGRTSFVEEIVDSAIRSRGYREIDIPDISGN